MTEIAHGKDRSINTLAFPVLTLLVEASTFPSLVIEPTLTSMTILQMNQDAREVFRRKGGRDPRPGALLEDYLPGGSCEAIRKTMDSTTDGEGRMAECYVPLDITGRSHPITVVPVRTDSGDGKFVKRVFVLIIRTGSRRDKDAQAAKLATLGEFAAGIAHELNTPLASISLIAENLLDEVKDEDVKKELRKILTQVDFSAKTVTEILSFARKENPTFELVDLRKVLDDALEKIKFERKYRVVLDVQPELPRVKADPHQMQEVFVNILRNAQEAMKDGGEIVVNVSSIKDWVVISIRDTGEGIPEENLELLFQPFFTTKPHGKGVGLGLSICQRILTNHKGELLVNSKVGEGSTFTIRLPRGEAK